MSEQPLVDYGRVDKVGVITLSRDPFNTYDAAFQAAFQGAWLTAKSDDTHVVVMLATGKHFCALGSGLVVQVPLTAPTKLGQYGSHVAFPQFHSPTRGGRQPLLSGQPPYTARSGLESRR